MNYELGIKNIKLIRLIGLTGLIVLMSFIGLMGGFAYAQSSPAVYFRADVLYFAPGSEFTAIIFVDSDEPVNVFSFEVDYNSQNIEFISFSDSSSIIDFWRGNPQMLKDGVLRIEGGTSKPFVGKAGEIIKLNFRAKEEGQTRISFRVANFYYADGLGTLAEAGSSFIDFAISSEAPLTTLGTLVEEDKTPPVILDARVAKSPIDNSLLAVFSVTDKESGLEKVLLRSRNWFTWGEWQDVSNPVRLAAGVWSFQLKAVDNRGNFTAETVYIGAELLKKLLYIILPVVILGGAYYIISSRRKRSNVA